MPVVQDSDMLHLNCPELYNVWKGQLYIHKHLVCNIELKSSNTCSIPSQLPGKLEIKNVIQLSELRKVLPRSIFEKADFTGQEVHCEKVICSLFPVTTSNVRGFELAKLLNWLRDQDLALIKILQDQGFLILVTSSALKFIKDLNRKDSFGLHALFLFPHTKLVQREREYCTVSKEDLSLKVTHLLPGLQYAILEAQQMQKGKDFKPNAVVELHVKQYARLQKKNVNIGEIKAADASSHSPQEEHASEKCDPLAISCLQRYFSTPLSFSLPLVKMSTLLKEDIPKSNDAEVKSKNAIMKDTVALDALLAANTNKSGNSRGKGVLHENKKQPSKKKTLKRGTRKSKKRLAPLPFGEESEIPDSSKTLMHQEEELPQVISPSRLTVKLASAPYPHGRKRGAEVLTAEFIHTNKISLTETVTDKGDKPQSPIITDKTITRKLREKSPMKEPFLRPDRPPKRKASEPGYRNKSPETKAISENLKRPMTRQQEQAGRQKEQAEKQLNKTIEAMRSFEASSSFRRASTDLKLTIKQSPQPAPIPENNIMEKRINMYESHALNLLADLALNSFCSSSIPYITSESVTPKSEPLVTEKAHEDDSANAVEYPQNDCNLPVQSSTASQEPSQASDCKNVPVKCVKDSNPAHTTPQQRSENSDKQTSYKVLIAAAKARARSNATSKISLEHSYSQLPKEDVPDTLSKEVSEETSVNVTEPNVTSPATVATPEQSSDLLLTEEVLVKPCDNAGPEISKELRAVSKLQDKFFITFNWDTKYDFDLDSKFTNDPLEKTINRALHGPWNPHLKEKVEDVKIILHMWLALFYSKPSQPVPSSSRKVVEHSNPAKYVSINTVLDPCFETGESDDAQLNYLKPETDPLIDADLVQQELEKSNSYNLPIDLSLSSSKPKKDYNIKLSSEIFQMYNSSSLSALYSDSLQTTMMCKMMPTSKISTPPTNNMTTGSIPTARYIGDSKQANAELTTKTDKGVDIGGSSSAKAGFRESEHKYSKGFFDLETQRSRNTDKGINVSHDAASKLYENKDNSFTSKKSSTPIVASSLNDINKVKQATAESESAASQKSSSHFTNKDAGVSSSNAFSTDNSANLLHQQYKPSRLSSTSKENIPKSDLVSWMQQKNVHACSERDETIIQTAKNRIVLKPKIQKKTMDAAVGKRESVDLNSKSVKERETSNFHLVLTDGNRSELVISESSSPLADDISQAQSLSNENLADKKAPETDRGLSVQSVCSEQSNGQENGKDNTTSCMGPPEEINAFKSNQLHDIKDTNALIQSELPNNNLTEAKGHPSNHKDILGKWSEESQEELEEGKVNSVMGKNVVNEMAASEGMSKLELSPSSDETSDVDNMDTDDCYLEPGENDLVCTAGTGLLQNRNQKAASVEQTVPEENCDKSKSLITLPITKQTSEMNMLEKKDMTSSDVTGDTTDDLSTLSTDPQLKSSETVNNQFLHSDSAVEDAACEGEAPDDNKQAVLNEETGQFLSAEKPGEHAEMLLGGEHSFTDSDSPKFADLGETSLFDRLNSESTKDECIGRSSAPVEQHGSRSPVYSRGAPLVECPVEPTDLSGSPVVDPLYNNTETGNCSETVPQSESLKVTPDENLLDGEQELCKQSEISPVKAHADQPSPESHSDYTSNAINVKSSKDRDPRIQSAIRKEFFHKLKRICLSSGAGQHASSNLEDGIDIVHEEPDKSILEGHTKMSGSVALSKPELSTKSTSKAQEDKTDKVILEENLVQEIPVFAASLTDVEPETLLELDQMTAQSECLSPAHQDLIDGVGQSQVQHKCPSPTNSDLIHNKAQDPVHEKFPSSPISVVDGNIEQNLVENECPDPPSVDLNDNVEQGPFKAATNVNFKEDTASSPVVEESLVPPNANLIKDLEQDPMGENILPPHNIDFNDIIPQCLVSERGLVQDTTLVPPCVDSIDSKAQDPVQDKNISPTNDFNDRLQQNHVQVKTLTPSCYDLNSNVELDHVQDKCPSPFLGDITELQEQDLVQNKCINPPNNNLIENFEIDPVQGLPPLHDDMMPAVVQNKSPLNVGLINIIEQNPLQNKCATPPHIDFIDGLDQSPVPGKCRSPSHDEFTDSMEQEEQSEICCIVSTGSISKAQYERWSETSDEEIEVIQAYKETLSDKAILDPRSLGASKPSRPSKKKRHSDSIASFMESVEENCPSPKAHRNIIVSKNDDCRTVHRESLCAGIPNLDGLVTNRRMALNDLTQHTIETEQLRFTCRLKDILRKLSTDVSEPPFQTMFESKRIPSFSGSRTKCKSPLRITVHCSSRRKDWRGNESLQPSSSYEQAYNDDEPWDRPTYYSRTPKKVRTHKSFPYHFNRLRYENTLEKQSSDIAVILNECVQSNYMKLRHISLGNTGAEMTSTSQEPEESRWQTRQMFESHSSKSQTVGNIISDLCTGLHSKLHSVAKKTAKQNLYFYLCKTVDGMDDEDFFSSTKALLIKEGYTPIEPQDFCDREQAESNRLVVVIKNENVSSYIHKIPCLLQLKLHPDVMFAGVDSPEDVTESMHQELFQAGGFVVSNNSILENVMIGKLNEVLMVLERMNRTSAWKWLIHYGENRKLKEDKRIDSASPSKMALLKSYQHSNIIEILPYHQCDSKSKEPSSDLKCLLDLQSQHICSRLAVYLTAMPCSEAADFQQNGILVYDVDTFIEQIQKVDAQLQSSSWL